MNKSPSLCAARLCLPSRRQGSRLAQAGSARELLLHVINSRAMLYPLPVENMLGSLARANRAPNPGFMRAGLGAIDHREGMLGRFTWRVVV